MNYWQALKWQNKFDEVRKEVQDVDLSAKGGVYQLARLALLDDFAGFFKMLPSVLKSGQLKKQHLLEWPIFREVRKQPKFRAFEKGSRTKQSKKKTVTVH